LSNNDEKDAIDGDFSQPLKRRSFIRNSIFAGSAVAMSCSAEARGLVQFPCKDHDFLNTYHFFRAGESLLDEEGVWSTNPLFLTNKETALTEKGIDQVTEMCKELRSDGAAPTVVRYSLAAAATDSSNIIGKELKVGRERIVPEFKYMDPRAIGAWDTSQLDVTKDAVWALDVDEAGTNGVGGRPPSNEDGTPHETLSDQVVRLQNLLSVLETQYSGDTILLVFPDGTGPALLTCLIGGIPLNRVHEFEYLSGEVVLDINYKSAHALLQSKPSEEYEDTIVRGRKKLKNLRDNPPAIINVRDQQFAEELRQKEEVKAALIKEANAKKDLESMEKVRTEKEAKAKKDLESMEKVRTEKEAQAKKDFESMEKARTQQLQQLNSSTTEEPSVGASTLAIGGFTAVGVIGAFSPLGEGEDEEPSTATESSTQSLLDNPDDNVDVQKCKSIPDSFVSKSVDFEDITSSSKADKGGLATSENVTMATEAEANDNVKVDIESKSSDDIIEDEPRIALSVGASLPSAWDPNEDDGGAAWLGALSEMMNEDDDI